MQLIALFLVTWFVLGFLFTAVAGRRWPNDRHGRPVMVGFAVALLFTLPVVRFYMGRTANPDRPSFEAQLARAKAEAAAMPKAAAFDSAELQGLRMIVAHGMEHAPRVELLRASTQSPMPALALNVESERRYLVLLRDTIRLVVQARAPNAPRGAPLRWVQYPLEGLRLESCARGERNCVPVADPQQPAEARRFYRIGGRPAGSELFPVRF